MAIRYDNVIVFGPTGDVGGAAALEASKRGAKVWLAMRDTSKTIDGITDQQERSGKFARVQADLSNPETVRKAVQHSGAKAAYVYLVHAPGGIKGALQAMKEAGVEYVVLLSSFTVKKSANLREIPPEAFIPYAHAQGEIALEDIGMAHTALRPGYFSTNSFKMSMDYSKTPQELYVFAEGKRPVDNIVPTDIGRVGGAVLVDRPSTSSKEAIYLYGPTITTELETCNAVRKHYSKEVKVVQLTPDQWVEQLATKGFPPPLIQYFKKALNESDPELYAPSIAKEGATNVKKYSGYEPTSLEDYVKSRKD